MSTEPEETQECKECFEDFNNLVVFIIVLIPIGLLIRTCCLRPKILPGDATTGRPTRLQYSANRKCWVYCYLSYGIVKLYLGIYSLFYSCESECAALGEDAVGPYNFLFSMATSLVGTCYVIAALKHLKAIKQGHTGYEIVSVTADTAPIASSSAIVTGGKTEVVRRLSEECAATEMPIRGYVPTASLV